ncbi:MAG: M20 family metallopeptidase [Actinobacteria bacterium]|nr:M20 family metallopeptidase [Actinomycetota bacterium]
MRDDADIEALKARAIAAIDAAAADLVEVSHDIHGHPEQNYEERFAADLLARTASRHGMDVALGVYGPDTAVGAEFGGGPLVCVMSEYDALPDIGHGCGHNVIAAAGLGAAIGLAAVAGDAGGRLRWLGTPAEEGGGGKIVMARNGALADVELAMMVHSADADLTQIDAIALQQLVVEYTGTEAHAAAAPHMGRNALDAAVLGYMGVAALRQHIRSTERVHGIFTKAGDKPNIVPREAGTEWYVRSDTIGSLEELKPRVLAALEAGAHACGCGVSHRWVGAPYADLISNDTAASLYVANAARLGRSVSDPRTGVHRVVGSTDMGNVSHLVPTIHPMIAAAPRGTVIHTADFATHARGSLADAAVVDGAKAMALTVIDAWVDGGVRRAIAEEFSRTGPDTSVL